MRCSWFLWYILGENVFGSIEVAAERIVIDLSGGATVTVFSDEQVENCLSRWHKPKLLQNAQELLGSHVQRLSAVEVLETGFQ